MGFSIRSVVIPAVLLFASCGGGGGSSSNDVKPSQNACGILGLNSRIISGTQCSGTSPVVKIKIVDSQGTFYCSGTMIAPNKVLTASHCLTDETFTTPAPASGMTISSGNEDAVLARGKRIIEAQQAVTDLQTIADVAAHRGDDPASSNFDLLPYIKELGLSDVGVLVLDRNVNLPTAAIRVSALPADGTIISIFGYGMITPDVPVASDAVYSGQMTLAEIGPKNLFANFGKDGSDTCNGDSGGPALAQEADGTYSIVGTTLGGSAKCVNGDTAIFTAMAGSGIPAFLRSAAPDAHYR